MCAHMLKIFLVYLWPVNFAPLTVAVFLIQGKRCLIFRTLSIF